MTARVRSSTSPSFEPVPGRGGIGAVPSRCEGHPERRFSPHAVSTGQPGRRLGSRSLSGSGRKRARGRPPVLRRTPPGRDDRGVGCRGRSPGDRGRGRCIGRPVFAGGRECRLPLRGGVSVSASLWWIEPPDWVEVLEGCAWAMIEAGQRLHGLGRGPIRFGRSRISPRPCAWPRVIATETGVDVRAMSVGDSGLGVVRDNQILSLLGGKAPPVDGITDTAVVALPRIPVPPATGRVAAQRQRNPPGRHRRTVGSHRSRDGSMWPASSSAALGPDLPDQADFLRVVDLYKETHDDDRTLVAVRRHQPPKPSENPESA